MPLSGGVTAIVGPNGAGKSNITDAVLFALGEASPGLLRAGAMSDLIFSGSESLPAAAAAEVTLILDNASGGISLPYEEISLTRRITREGDSEYRINGVRSRLADVRVIAGEAGLGRHSILRQGAVDAIVSGGPSACRNALEEAAGLGVFRRRRLTAARKLERAETQFEQVHQIEEELGSQLRRIEAEAESAREYRDLESRYRSLSLAHLYRIATRGTGDLRGHLKDREREAATYASHRDELRERTERMEASASGIGTRLADTDRILNAMERAAEWLASGGLRAERAMLRAERVRDRTGERARSATALEDALRRTESTVWELEEKASRMEAARDENRAALDSAEERTARLRDEQSSYESERSRISAELDSLRSRRQSLDREAGHRESISTEEIEVLTLKIAGISVEPMASEDAGTVRKLRDQASALLAEAGRRRGALSAVTGRLEAEARALRPKAEKAGPGTRLYEVLRARPGYEAAVEAALGELSEGVLAANLDECMDYLRAERVVVRLDAEKVHENGRLLPGRPLFECVEVVEERYADAVQRLLGGTYVVQNAAESTLGNGYVAVTRDGLRLTRTSASRRVEEGEISRSARLRSVLRHLDSVKGALATELRECEEVISTASRKIDTVGSLYADLNSLALRMDQAASRLQSLAGRRLDQARETAERERRWESETRDLDQRIADFETGLGEAEISLVAIRERREAASGEAERAYAALREITRDFTDASSAAQRAASERDRLTTALSHVREGDAANMLACMPEIIERTAAAAGRISKQITARRERLRERRSYEAAELQNSSDMRARIATEVADLAGKLAAAESATVRIREDLEAAEHNIGRARQEISEEWGATIETAREEAEKFHHMEGDPAAERQRLARRLKSFGDVNLLAISQESELRERYNLVSTQLADAESAALELNRIIDRLDTEIEGRFGGLFRRARAAFGEMVPRMMAGAAGELELSEEGVEISLRLGRKGHRLLNVLSGGERSLLALSFLFGIFLGRSESVSGAFCILDEAEAALDDVNLARFLAVVDSYRSDGQFLLVTHQKRTMASADVLYGVTTDASGATTVVSKRLSGE